MAKYVSMDQIEKSGYVGTLYSVVVIAMTIYYDEGSDTGSQECVYWDDGHDTHPYEGAFDNYEEAKAHALAFTQEMAEWAHTHGIGPEYEGISCDVLEFERLDDGDFSCADTRLMNEWCPMDQHEVIEFDDDWDQHTIG